MRSSEHLKKPVNRSKDNSSDTVSAHDSFLIVRIVIASLMLSLSLIITGLTSWIRLIILIIASIIAGYDVIIFAVRDISRGQITTQYVIISISAITAFIIGFGSESVAVLVIYQIGRLLVEYAKEKNVRSGLELLENYVSQPNIDRIDKVLHSSNNKYVTLEKNMMDSAKKVIVPVILFAIAYAVAAPMLPFVHFGYNVSIHRAVVFLLTVAPASVTASYSSAAAIGLCYAARNGFFFDNARGMEVVSRSKTFVFDNDGLFDSEEPRILYVHSDMFSTDVFLNICYNTVYFSNQSFARAISSAAKGELFKDLIADFADIPGYGSEVRISGTKVVLATRQYFVSKGITIPDNDYKTGITYYLYLEDRYSGRLSVSTSFNEDTVNLATDLKNLGNVKSVLINSGSQSEAQNICDELNINELYNPLNQDEKDEILRELTRAVGDTVYIISKPELEHSGASVDMLVGKAKHMEDAYMLQEGIKDIPFAYRICCRVAEVSTISSIFVFTVKAILIFLAILGYSNLWFVIFIDVVIQLASIIVSIRVTNESLINTFLNKINK